MSPISVGVVSRPSAENSSGQAPPSPPERPYLQALPAARTDVLHRFLRRLLRGGVTELGLPEPWVGDPGSIPDDVLPDGAPPDWPEEFDGDGAGTLRGPATHERVGVVSFPEAGRSVVVPVEAVGGYDRYHLGAPVVVVGPDESGRLRHPVDLVGLLDEAGAFDDPEQSDVVEAEVAESVANLADPVPFKALTKMRLQGKRHAYATSQVSNPLAGERE